VHRNPLRLGWQGVGALYVLAAASGGATAGAGLGWLGNGLSTDARAAFVSAVALVGIAMGAVTLLGVRVKPLQCDRETSQRWVWGGALVWPIANGGALGFGATSRLGFFLWYAIPAATLFSGSPLLGAIIWGTYGLTRGAAVWLIMAVERRKGESAHQWLPLWRPGAEQVTAGYGLALSMVAIVTVGL
jgi:hypothetical protein